MMMTPYDQMMMGQPQTFLHQPTHGKKTSLPSVVLCVKSHDASERQLIETAIPFCNGQQPKIFCQEDKGLAFIQFPTIHHSYEALQYFNCGQLQTMTGKVLSAEYSTRQEVQVRVNPKPKPNLPPQQKQQNQVSQGPSNQPGAPSPVLCVKTDMNIHDLGNFLLQQIQVSHLPQHEDILVVNGKSMAFVQYPSISDSGFAMDLLNSLKHQGDTSITLSAMYSNRQSIARQPHQFNNSGGLTTEERTIIQQQEAEVDPETRKRLWDQTDSDENYDGSKKQRSLCAPLNATTSIQQPIHGPNTQPGQPSEVIVVRTDLHEVGLRTFLEDLNCAPKDILYCPGKQMAFVEYPTLEESEFALTTVQQAHHINPETGFRLTGMYSTRHSIHRGHGGQQQDLSDEGGQTSNVQTARATRTGELSPNRVIIVGLKVIDYNAQQQSQIPTVDHLVVPFAKCGMVEKLIIFQRKDSSGMSQIQCLIQYMTVEYATYAKEKFHQQILGPYRLNVNFSDRKELEVSTNSDRMRDFTNPWLEESG